MVEFSCILAAVAFMAANVMKVIYFIKERNRSFDWEKYTALDPDYLVEDWEFRFDKQALFLSSGFLNAFGWICLASPLIQLGWLLSKQGTQNLSLNVSIIMLAIGGALTEWLSNLFWIGTYLASKTMVLNFELDWWLTPEQAQNIGQTGEDGLGWKTLEINHIAASGFIWFTDAFEWLCLGCLFFCTFLSVRRWRQYDRTSFGGRWNSLSLFMSFLSFAEFAAQILRFEGFRTAGRVSIFYGMLNRFILMPAWIISLGVQLPRAVTKQAYGGGPQLNDAEFALTEMSSAVATNGAPNEGGEIRNPFEDVDDLTGASGDKNPFVIDDADEQAP
mmetsp:Transcript_57641/g.86958  ORF Transcript_57641/g.86958 Transcript_57641/m.86958 type:complete len:332 (+) Transcript_57641:134-1129(+)